MSKKKKVLVIPGDYCGPEVTREGVRVLRFLAQKAGLELELLEGQMGGSAYDAVGEFLPAKTLSLGEESDAILFGALGGPKWDLPELAGQAEKALLGMRSKLDLYTNLRPVQVFPSLVEASPLKSHLVEGVDVMIIRELTGGIYFGEPRGIFSEAGVEKARNTLEYARWEIERIVEQGFQIAKKRRNRLVSVDKANVLEVSRLWRQIATEVGQKYPEVSLSHLYIDAAAMELLRNPKEFDTIVTDNLFGDILSDEASMLPGSIGMLPSASLGEKTAFYEPIHGSAPTLAGKNVVNPLASILSVGMMFRYSFHLRDLDDLLNQVVAKVLETCCTADLEVEGKTLLGTKEMGDKILQELEKVT